MSALEKYRGWWVPKGGPPRLLSDEFEHTTLDGPPDTKPRSTVWGENTPAPRCARNPDHVPPAEGCVCGLWALNLMDVLYGWQMKVWERQLLEQLGIGSPAGPTDDYVYVVGRVTLLGGAILDDIEAYPGLSIPHWRAKAARIDEFWVPTNELQSDTAATEMSEKLVTAFTRCRIQVGSPEYGMDDWNARTLFEGQGPAGVMLPDYPDIGLRPPPGVRTPAKSETLRAIFGM